MPTTHEVPSGAAAMVWMIFSVEPTSSAGSHDVVAALGMDDDLDAGMSRRAVSTASTLNRPCTEQCPRHRIIRARSQLLAGEAAVRLVRVAEDAVVEGQAEVADRGVAAEVLVGQEQHLAGAVEAAALVEGPLRARFRRCEVQTVPPCRPVKAMMAAEEFM